MPTERKRGYLAAHGDSGAETEFEPADHPAVHKPVSIALKNPVFWQYVVLTTIQVFFTCAQRHPMFRGCANIF